MSFFSTVRQLFLRKTSGTTETGTRRIGAWGEEAAAAFLKQHGYTLLGRNVRFGGRNELDIVARAPQQAVLVFVEVKTRRSEQFGRAASAVNAHKRKVLGRAAMKYMKRLKEKPRYIRFDVVEVIGQPGGKAPVIRHIENAFSPGNAYRLPW